MVISDQSKENMTRSHREHRVEKEANSLKCVKRYLSMSRLVLVLHLRK